MNNTATHSIHKIPEDTLRNEIGEDWTAAADGACEPQHATAGGGNSRPDDLVSWSSLARSRPR